MKKNLITVVILAISIINLVFNFACVCVYAFHIEDKQTDYRYCRGS